MQAHLRNPKGKYHENLKSLFLTLSVRLLEEPGGTILMSENNFRQKMITSILHALYNKSQFLSSFTDVKRD